jgi:hypothetical protein
MPLCNMQVRLRRNPLEEQTLERALAEVEAPANDQLEGKERAMGRALEVEVTAEVLAQVTAEVLAQAVAEALGR